MPDPIVILGGGFAGAETARRLQAHVPHGQEVILFSRENHLCYTPLLAEVVGASIEATHVVAPVRQFARQVTCRTAVVTAIDLARREVTYLVGDGHSATQKYGQLVLACGAITNLDVMPGMAAHGKPLKTLGDALLLRNHIISMLEQAEAEPDLQRRQTLVTFVVVGGGFSGVEVAGEVFDLVSTSRKYYRTLRQTPPRVVLVHSRDHLLPELPAKLGDFAQHKMEGRGIEILLNVRVQAVTEYGVRLPDGSEIAADTVICTVGTATNPLLTHLGLPMDKGRVKTDGDMRVTGHPEVWALGDCAAVPNAGDSQISPPLAQFAVRQARRLARNIAAVLKGGKPEEFRYHMKGAFAAIGHHNAVGQAFGISLSGFFAWFLWRGFYLSQMPTFARKLQIAFDWAWQMLFARDIVEISVNPTQRLARAHFEPGQYVVRQGDPADKFYVIEKGKAGVYLDGQPEPVALLGPGDHFGERALLKNERRAASVKAEEPLDVVTIAQTSFQDLVATISVLRSRLQSDVARIEANREFREVARKHKRLNATHARDVMSVPVRTLPLNLTYGEALAHVRREGRGAYSVLDDRGRMVGIVTQTDFYQAVRGLKPPQTPLADVMQRQVLTVRESDSLADAMLKFLNHPVKRLVVVADDDPQKPVGMLTPFDILPLLTEPDDVPAGALV